MTRARAVLGAALAAAAAAGGPAGAQSFSRIGDAERFAAIVVGRELVSADGGERFRARADGGLVAEIGGARYAGSWDWFEDRMCRVLRQGDARVARCARAAIGRGRLRLYWNEGGATEYLLR